MIKISLDQLRKDLIDIIDPYGYTVEDFLASDIDDLENGMLRDVYLMVKGVL